METGVTLQEGQELPNMFQREVISMHVGQAGVQMAAPIWTLYCAEQRLEKDGTPLVSDHHAHNSAFFIESCKERFCPRALLIDLEPLTIDSIKNGEQKGLYNPMFLCAGKEDAANNFARGFYTVGREISENVKDQLRKMAEGCDRLQGFLTYKSLGGGTGSGFSSYLAHEMSKEYPKKSQLDVSVFPSPQMATSVVEPYNTILATSSAMIPTDCSFLVDNEALYTICTSKLDVDCPTYKNLNGLLAQTISSLTASLRFDGRLNADFVDFQTNLVPFPRIHFPILSYAPLISYKSPCHDSLSVAELTNECFDSHNSMMKCDLETGKYMACCILYRGDVTPKDVNEAINLIKGKRSINFVDWSPTGFKVGLNSQPPTFLTNSNLANLHRAACMFSNTTAVGEAWRNLLVKYRLMFEKSAFLHWYTGEGLELDEFVNAGEDILTLTMDYMEANSENMEEYDNIEQ